MDAEHMTVASLAVASQRFYDMETRLARMIVRGSSGVERARRDWTSRGSRVAFCDVFPALNVHGKVDVDKDYLETANLLFDLSRFELVYGDTLRRFSHDVCSLSARVKCVHCSRFAARVTCSDCEARFCDDACFVDSRHSQTHRERSSSVGDECASQTGSAGSVARRLTDMRDLGVDDDDDDGATMDDEGATTDDDADERD